MAFSEKAAMNVLFTEYQVCIFHTFNIFCRFLPEVKWCLSWNKWINLWLFAQNRAAQTMHLGEKQQTPNKAVLMCEWKQLYSCASRNLCHLRLINCSGLFQLAHLPTGDQTASTRATATMELSAVPTMGSASAPRAGLAFTAHRVSGFCAPSSSEHRWQNYPPEQLGAQHL